MIVGSPTEVPLPSVVSRCRACTIEARVQKNRNSTVAHGSKVMQVEHEQETVRIEVLRRLAEQAMTDLEFRSVARDDLELALRQYGYDLNETEMTLVLKFRVVLDEAGLDLSLTGELEEQARDLLTGAGLDAPRF